MEQAMDTSTQTVQFGKALRGAASLISYLLHPLFVPALVAVLLLFVHPIYTLLEPHDVRVRLMAMVAINTILFPGLIAFLLYKLGFMKSLQMETQRERIIPLAGAILFYFWAFYVSRNLDSVPPALKQWLLGVFLASCFANFINIWKKISLHSMGMGGLMAFCAWQQATDPYWDPQYLLWALLLGGLVGTARLIKNAHTNSELYLGYLGGIACQVAAGIITGM